MLRPRPCRSENETALEEGKGQIHELTEDEKKLIQDQTIVDKIRTMMELVSAPSPTHTPRMRVRQNRGSYCSKTRCTAGEARGRVLR